MPVSEQLAKLAATKRFKNVVWLGTGQHELLQSFVSDTPDTIDRTIQIWDSSAPAIDDLARNPLESSPLITIGAQVVTVKTPLFRMVENRIDLVLAPFFFDTISADLAKRWLARIWPYVGSKGMVWISHIQPQVAQGMGPLHQQAQKTHFQLTNLCNTLQGKSHIKLSESDDATVMVVIKR